MLARNVDDLEAIRKDVMSYAQMIIGLESDLVGLDNIWRYVDWQTENIKEIEIDKKYIDDVEARVRPKLSSIEERETFRIDIITAYATKISIDPYYDLMDEVRLVGAVTDMRVESV